MFVAHKFRTLNLGQAETYEYYSLLQLEYDKCQLCCNDMDYLMKEDIINPVFINNYFNS